MKLVRLLHNGKERYGTLEGEEIQLMEGSPFGTLKRGDARLRLSEARLLAPVLPGKALCIGLNYRDHAIEFDLPIPSSPVVFIKPPSALLAPGAEILRPRQSHRVDFEAELVVIIGRKAKAVPAARAFDYIAGYTCGNDVTARDLQPKDGQWTVAKSFDTFMPLGPWIETELDPSNLAVSAYLNGEKKQSSNTVNLIFGVPELVEFLSSVMTLEPGDLIMTGTPSGVGPMNSGDEIAVEIQGIGRLVNKVR
ncbi:MAG TPA: hypothetical protein DCQ16_02910 [Spirochaetaceae bacterium]|nr:hypothetical protein [Spirochaetaceae bacterium]